MAEKPCMDNQPFDLDGRLRWCAKEFARLHVNMSASHSMPHPVRVECVGFVAEVRAEGFSPAPRVTLEFTPAQLFMPIKMIHLRLTELVKEVLRERRDYKHSLRPRVLAALRIAAHG